MQKQNSKSLLEKFLTIFTEVKPGEGITAVMLTLNVFLVLTSYYIAKVVREPLILAGGGAEVKSYSAAGQAILLVGAVRLYSWLAGKYPRKHLINLVNIFFAGCLVVFYVLSRMQAPLGVIFFLWVGIFSVMVVAQFWSFANDIYTPEDGKRLFAIVAFGASAGAVFGSYIAGQLIDLLGVYQLLLVSSCILVLSLLVTNYVDAREKTRANKQKLNREAEPDEPIGAGGGFKLVFSNKYLLMIAFLILLLNWVNTTGEYILGRIVQNNAEEAAAAGNISEKAFIGKFYANFFTVVNLAGLLIQLFLVSRILKYLGIRIAVLILPVIALGGYFILASYPLLFIVRWAKTAENATDYSLNNTVRHALFLPTSREEKYKAKQAVDSFFQRAGDVLSAVLVFVGVNLFLFSSKDFALVNLGLVIIWLILAYKIGQTNKRLVEEQQKFGTRMAPQLEAT